MSEANATAPAAPAASEPMITVTQVPIPEATPDDSINIEEAIAIFNGGAPAVEDKPAPAAKAAKPAVPAGEQPDDIDEGIVVEVPGGVEAAAPAAPAAADVKTEIAKIAADYGIDPTILTQFPDVDSAYTAIALFADQYANVGLDAGGPSGAPAVPYPTQQAAPAAPAAPDPLEFNLDEAALDDKSLAAFHGLKAALTAERQERAALRADVDHILQQSATAHKQQLHARAAAVVDSLGSEKYGTSANRTAAQRLAVNKLYAIADNMQIGLANKGLVVPPIEQVLRQAALADGVRPTTTKAAAVATDPAAPPVAAVAPAPAPKPAPAPPRPLAPGTVALSPNSHLGNLHRDPAFMGAAAKILSRPS